MVLPLSGQLTLQDIANEFNRTGNTPYILSQFLANGVAGVHPAGAPNVPTSTAIPLTISAYRNAFRLLTPIIASIPAQSGTTSSVNTITPLQTELYTGLPLTWSITSSIPNGISINSSTGVVTIAQSSSVNATITIRATGPSGLFGSQNISLNFSPPLSATTIAWATRAGVLTVPLGNRFQMGVAAHGTNGMVISAQFQGNFSAVSAGGGTSSTLNSISSDSHSNLVYYNANGGVMWVANMGSTNTNTLAVSGTVACAADGSIYSAGYIQSGTSTSTFNAFNGNGTQFSTSITISNASSGYLLKHNAAGVVQWFIRVGSGPNNTSQCCTTADGNVYVVGLTTSSSLTFGSTTLSYNSPVSGLDNGYIASFTENGTVRWAAKIENIRSSTTIGGLCITSHVNNGIVVSGNYRSNDACRLFNANGSTGATITGPTNGVYVFHARYSTTGTLEWFAKVENSLAGQGSDTTLFATCSTNDGSFYATGTGWGFPQMVVTSGNGTTTSVPRPSYTSNHIHYIKFNSSGLFQMAFANGGNNTSQPTSITPTADNGFFTTLFTVADPFNAFNSNGTNFISYNRPFTVFFHSVVLCYNSSGVGQWGAVTSPEGTSNAVGMAYCYGAALMPDGKLGMAGYWQTGQAPSIRIFNSSGTASTVLSTYTSPNSMYIAAYQ